MKGNGITSLSSRLNEFFGKTDVERERARDLLGNDPAAALDQIGFKADERIVERFINLDKGDKDKIVDLFERVARYNTDFLEDHTERIQLLKDLKSVFDNFSQWEETLEHGTW